MSHTVCHIQYVAFMTGFKIVIAILIADKSLHIRVCTGIRHGDYSISLSKILISSESIFKISPKFFGQ